MSFQERATRETLDRRLEEVFARPEFQDRGDLEESLGNVFEGVGEGIAQAGGTMVRLLPIFLFLGLLYFTVRAMRANRGRTEFGEVRGAVSVKERVAELFAEAREARGRGDRRLALRLYCFALVAGLGASGDVSYRPAWTNRELLRRGQPKADARRLLEELISELEPKEYGRDEVTEGDLEHLEGLCRSHLGAALLEGGVG